MGHSSHHHHLGPAAVAVTIGLARFALAHHRSADEELAEERRLRELADANRTWLRHCYAWRANRLSRHH